MQPMNFNVNIPVSFFKEGDAYVAYCPILDLSTSASTFEKVKERFGEVVEVFFEELVDMGTLDDVLASLGWTKIQSKWTPPFQVGHDLQRVTVPLSA